MGDERSGKITIFEALRFVTPILSAGTLFVVGLLFSRIDKLDDKIFKHLTNDDIHTPKMVVVTRPEFEIYQQMRDRQMQDIKEAVLRQSSDTKDIKDLLVDHMRETEVQPPRRR